jgi:uncharacterized protein YceK
MKIIFVSLIILLLVGCGQNLKKAEVKSGPTDFDALGKVLGCMFAPHTCPTKPKDKKKQEEYNKQNNQDWDKVK